MRSERNREASRAILVNVVGGLLTNFVIIFFPAVVHYFGQPKTVIILFVCAILSVGYVLYFYSRYLGSLWGAEAIVVSALVLDGDKVLLTKEEAHGRHKPWLLPPAAHLLWHTVLKEAPHQAVITEVREKAGIDIQIDAAKRVERHDRVVMELAKPFFVQSEKQQWWLEGHAIHYNFYYIGHLLDSREVTKAKGNYEWVGVNDLSQIHIPKELIGVIRSASKLMNRKDRR